MATRVTDGANTGDARLAALPLPRAWIALTKSEEKEGLLAVYRFYDGMGDTNLPPTPLYNSRQGGSRDPPLVGLLLSNLQYSGGENAMTISWP